MKIETCAFCNEATGRAGKGEDSIYLDGIGPLCNGCYDKIASCFSDANLESDLAKAKELIGRMKEFIEAMNPHTWGANDRVKPLKLIDEAVEVLR